MAIQRLPLRHQATEFFQQASKQVTSHFVIYIRPSAVKVPRFAVIVAKKRLAKAAARNQWKRVVRAALAQVLPAFEQIDVVVLFKRDISKKPFTEITQEIEIALTKENEKRR